MVYYSGLAAPGYSGGGAARVVCCQCQKAPAIGRGFVNWHRGFSALLAEFELLEDRLVAVGSGALQIVEERSALGDQLEQAAARGVILGMAFEVLGEIGDTLGEERDLHIRAAGIFIVEAQRGGL